VNKPLLDCFLRDVRLCGSSGPDPFKHLSAPMFPLSVFSQTFLFRLLPLTSTGLLSPFSTLSLTSVIFFFARRASWSPDQNFCALSSLPVVYKCDSVSFLIPPTCFSFLGTRVHGFLLDLVRFSPLQQLRRTFFL